LHRVSGEGGGTLKTSLPDPWIGTALSKVLPAHDDRTDGAVAGDMMIDILRSIGLVVHEEAAFAEAQILCDDCIAFESLLAPAGGLAAPQPKGSIRREPKGRSMMDAVRLALPDDPVLIGSEAHICSGADDFADERICSSGTQEQAGNTAAD